MTKTSTEPATLYRVTYTTSGLRRRVKTVDEATLRFLERARHLGIRVSSSRKATDAEIARGAWTGFLNS